MFERYTEKARRTVFFARYEASQFGCPYIETEHLLLGLFREDKALANQFLGSHAKLEDIRNSITQRTKPGPTTSTSVDLPLSHECHRVLAYGAEESERMGHEHIGTAHLLVGLLREEKSFAAQLLREQGLALAQVREQVRQSEPPPAEGRFASIAGLDQWLAEYEANGSIWAIRQQRVGNRTTHFAIYAADRAKEGEQDLAPAEKLALIQKRIHFITKAMERAIANHEFDKGRFYSEEERKERENLRRLCEQFHLEERPGHEPVPPLCIEIIRGDLFSEVRKRCDNYLVEGVAEVWLLDPDSKRAYTVTKAEGLREFKGEFLRIANPPLEMDLRKVFDL